MGQQQLLLVILVTIIVGIATVVAINTFGSAADSANLDAVRQDMGSIAASAQAYYMKPGMLGGGGNSFDGMTFNDITFAGEVDGSDNMVASNENGSYEIEISGSGTGNGFTITATPSSQADAGTDAETIGAYVGADCINMGGLGEDAPSSCDGSTS